MLRKLVLIHACFVLLATGVLYSEVANPNLVWNMCLALLALNCSVVVRTGKKWYVKFLVLPIWLLAYPNTFYLLTDLKDPMVTATGFGDQMSIFLFVLYVGSILLGVFSGVLSFRYVVEGLGIKQAYLRLVLILALSVFSSGMIYLRLSAALTDWQLLLNWLALLGQFPTVFSRQALPFLLGLTFIQFLALLFMEKD